jgi:hypothetical protein
LTVSCFLVERLPLAVRRRRRLWSRPCSCYVPAGVLRHLSKVNPTQRRLGVR